VDVLFLSAARIAGPITIGVILTGMGKDGVDGMLELRKARGDLARTNPAIYGMPRAVSTAGRSCVSIR
jgi:two-component system chemotaxis response regulator CheB